MKDCLFCKMVSGEIAPDLVYADESVLAFRDIGPQAPVHVLIIPKQHISTLNDLNEKNLPAMARLMAAVPKVAQKLGVAEQGYRTVINCNAAGGQTVFHIHVHLLGGRRMQWPPG